MTYKFEDLDFKRPLFVNSPFTFNGRAYQIGEAFPWSKMAVGKHIVARMWNGRKLRHTIQGAYAGVDPVVTDPVVTDPVVTDPVVTDPVVTDPVVTESTTPSTATPARLAHISAGWYNVEVDGLGPVNPAKLKGKAAAAKWAAENNYSIVVDSAQ